MALETGTFISDLVSTNPLASDNISQGDDHIRLIKATLKATFPNLTGAVTPTHTELSTLGSTGTPTFGGATLRSTDAGATAGPSLDLFRDSASPAANDLLGRLAFSGEDAVGAKTDYAYIEGVLIDPTNGSEDGGLRFQTLQAGVMTEAMRINENNKLLLGTTSYLDGWNTTQNVVLAGTANPGINIFQASNSNLPGVLTFNKSRGATPGALTAVASGDAIGSLNFSGADGFNARVTAARITGEVDGTPGLNDMPGRLVFSTTADGASSPSERVRIDAAGNVGIGKSTGLTARLSVYGGTLEFDPVSGTDEERALNFNLNGLNYGKILIPSGSGGAMAFWTGAAGAVSERVRITFAGDVGIGRTNPASKLDVGGTGNIFRTTDAGSSANFWSWFTNTTRRGYVGFGAIGDNHLSLFNESNADIRFATNATEAVRIKNTGLVGIGTDAPTWPLTVNGDIRSIGTGGIYVNGTGALGYGNGTGGTVTQATSRTTAVTLNKNTGRITLFTAAATTSWTSFTVNNSVVGATDTILIHQRSGNLKYQVFISNVAAGSFEVTFAATSGTTSEAPSFNFVVLNGQTA